MTSVIQSANFRNPQNELEILFDIEDILNDAYDILINNAIKYIPKSREIDEMIHNYLSKLSEGNSRQRNIHSKIIKWSKEKLKNLLIVLKNSISNLNKESFCKKMCECEKNFNKFIDWNKAAFFRIYNSTLTPRIGEIFYEKFIEEIYYQTKDEFIENLFLLINEYRSKSNMSNLSLIINSIKIIARVDVFCSNEESDFDICKDTYSKEFESTYLKIIEESCIAHIAENKLEIINNNRFVEHCMQIINTEINIMYAFKIKFSSPNFFTGRVEKCSELLHKIIIYDNKDIIINEFYTIFKKNRLAINREFCSNVDYLISKLNDEKIYNDIGDTMVKMINEDFDEVIAKFKQNDAKDCEKYFIDSFIKIMTEYRDIVNINFKNIVNILNKHINKCLESITAKKIVCKNVIDIQFVEIFAKFCDIILKKEYKIKDGFSENEKFSESWYINNMCNIIQLIQDKDIYEIYHKYYLTKRLLQSQYKIDLEIEFVFKCKKMFGYNLTKVWETLIRDITKSTELSIEFKEYLQNYHTEEDISSVTHLFNVFSQNSFNGKVVNILLHPIITNHMNTFEKYYFSKHSNRKLSWYNNNVSNTRIYYVIFKYSAKYIYTKYIKLL
jgi:hypothetical protein